MFIRRGISGAEEKEEVVKAKAKYKFLLVKLTFFVKERLLVKVFTEGKKSWSCPIFAEKYIYLLFP
jgi:hypothetical protein